MLSPYRALDLTGAAGFLCGKVLGDLGADVIKVEPPGGDPARLTPPFHGDVPDPEKSLYWLAYNNNKRGITVDITRRAGRDLFLKLVQAADFVLESYAPGYLDSLGLGYAELSRANPGIILVSITPFGQTGPYRDYRGSDLEVMALGGAMWVTGDPDDPPLRVTVPQSPMFAGTEGAGGAIAALLHRRRSGRGQHVDVAAQAAVILGLGPAPVYWDINGDNPQRPGPYITGRSVTGARQRAYWPCKDGWVNWVLYGGPAGKRTNKAMVAWMDEKGMAPRWMLEKDWDQVEITQITQDEVDAIEAVVGAFLQTVTKAEFQAEATRRKMLGQAVYTAADLLADEQLAARGFWQEVDDPGRGLKLRFPGPFARFGAGAPVIRRPAPRIGEHNREVLQGELGLDDAAYAALAAERVVE